MTSTYYLALNFNNHIPVKTDMTFKQGDKGITLNLSTSGLTTTGTTAHIVFKRSNGTSVEAELTGQSGPTYTYTILGNEFEVPGVVVADLKLYDGDTQRVSTASFIFQVTGDTLDGIGGGTGGYSDQLEQLSQEFEDTLEQYEEAFADVGAVHPAGNYDPTTEYSPLDLVYYATDNSTYLCLEQCTGETPSPSSQYWQLVVDGSNMSTPDFDDLGDVDMTGVQNGQVPTYNSATQKYEPGNGGGGGSAADITYDNTTSKLSSTKVQGAIDETNSRVTRFEKIIGGKNLNSFPYYNSSATIGGIVYTVYQDGSIKATQTATSEASFYMHSRTEALNSLHLDPGTYILSGCPSGGSQNTYCLILSVKDSDNVSVTVYDTGNGATITIPSGASNATVSIYIKSGTALPAGGLMFYPMIRDSSISDNAWQPYGASNFTEKTDISSIIATGTTNTTGAQIPNGAYFYLNGVFCRAIANIATSATFTKNTNYVETNIGAELTPAPTTTGISFSDCTHFDGGYVKIGKFAILNMRIKISTASSSAKVYCTLPSSIWPISATAILCENVSDDTAPVNASLQPSSGSLYLKNTVANKNFALSGIWIVAN